MGRRGEAKDGAWRERGKEEGYNDGKAKKIVGVIDDGRSKRGKVGEKRSEEMSGR